MALPRRTTTLAVTTEALPLQWANGKAEIRMNPTGRFVGGEVGFYVERGKLPAFDAFGEKHALPTIDIRHPRESGPPAIVTHWWLGTEIGFIPLTSGPVAATVAESLKQADATAAAGIGVRWPWNGRSKAAVRGYVVVMVDGKRQVFGQPVQLSARSKMSDVLLGCLALHLEVCAKADTIWERTQDDPVGCYEILLPLCAGRDEVWGKGNEKATITPFACGHPAIVAVDAAYLESVRCNPTILQLVQRDWLGVQAWAKQFGAQDEAAQTEAQPEGA